MSEEVKMLTGLMELLPKRIIFHNLETAQYMRIILRMMGKSDLERSLIWKGCSPFDYHDIGKAYIPEDLFTYTERFNITQEHVMMAHVHHGQQIFREIRKMNPLAGGFAEAGEMIALYHHECYDGSGYPEGLSGEAIPFLARVCAVANAFTGMQRDSVLLPSRSFEESLSVLEAHAGTWFDPEIVDVFVGETLKELKTERELRRLREIKSQKPAEVFIPDSIDESELDALFKQNIQSNSKRQSIKKTSRKPG
ncbi:MAG: HD domain-containing protein [Eubacteriaceae bacterium]|nr:HD domain-containing protein [Eubacteriaceae bacterium]MBR0384161.1 HD domain-containing protein [Eubacteriaceae bacterium]